MRRKNIRSLPSEVFGEASGLCDHRRVGSLVEDVQGAAETVTVALRQSGSRAHFSPSSLWELERCFDSEAPGGQARRGGLLAEELGPRLFALGCNVAGVLRRNVGDAWHGDDTDGYAEVNVALELSGGSMVWPVQRAMKRSSNGHEGIWVRPRTRCRASPWRLAPPVVPSLITSAVRVIDAAASTHTRALRA